jgi:hypothetical protein
MDYETDDERLIPVACPACGGTVQVANFEEVGDRFDCPLCDRTLEIESMTEPPKLKLAN